MQPHGLRFGNYYLLIVAVALFLGLRRESNLLLLTSGVLIWPAVVNFLWPGGILKRISVRVRAPEDAVVGTPAPLRVFLKTHSRRRFSGTILTFSAPGARLRLEQTREFSPERRTWEREMRWALTFSRRGEYTVSDVRIACDYPFGMFFRTRVFADSEVDGLPARILVPPKLREVPEFWERAEAALAFEQEHSEQAQTCQDGLFAGLRPWTAGDFWRQIHWRASARHQELLVQNLQNPAECQFLLIADFRHEDAQHAGEQLEERVSFAASVVHELVRRCGTAAGMEVWVLGSTCRRISTWDSADFLYDALRAFALVEPCGVSGEKLGEKPGETFDVHAEVQAFRDVRPGAAVLWLSGASTES